MNAVILSGRVGKAPTVQHTPSGQKAVTFSLAIDRKDKSGNKVTDWFSCTSYGKTADVIEQYVKQGSALEVLGSLQTRSWQKEDGTKASITFVMVDKVSFPVSNSRQSEGE